MMGVLRQSLVPDFGEAELALHDAKDMLDFGTHFRLVAVPGAILLSERDVAAAFFVREVFRPGGTLCNHISLASIGRITPNPCFVAVQQVADDHGVMDVGRCRHHVVNQLGATVHTDVGFHAKEPLVALAGLVHLRVALFLLVLGGTRGIDDTGIDNGPSVYFQTVLLEILIDQMKQLVAQIVALHQVTELADRGLVRHGLLAQINPNEYPHGPGIVQGFLGSGVGEIEPVLQKIDAEHALNPHRPTTGTLRVRIEGLDSFGELFPGNNGFHVLQKLLLAGLLTELFKAIGQGLLLHIWKPSCGQRDSVLSPISRINQRCPKS